MRELSRQVMALERAKTELEIRNRQLESSAARTKDTTSVSKVPSFPCSKIVAQEVDEGQA